MMKIINAIEMRKMPRGTVFCEYTPDMILSQLMVVDDGPNDTYGAFGATNVIPWHGEIWDWDCSSSADYRDDDLFMVFDNNDILQMIQTLTKCLNIELKEE